MLFLPEFTWERSSKVWGLAGWRRWNAKDKELENNVKVFFLLCSIPIAEKIEEIYKAFINESGIQFSELEEEVLQFHLSNLEYACGSNLHQVGFEDACFCVCVCFIYWDI